MENNQFIKLWASKFPFGLKEFTYGLSNEKRIAIASLLLEKKELRFSDIQNELKIEKNVLSQHLKKMQNVGLIKRTKSQWDESNNVLISKYSLNNLYKDLLENNIQRLNFVKEKRESISKPNLLSRGEYMIQSCAIDMDRNMWEANVIVRGQWSLPKDSGGKEKWLIVKNLKKN